MAYVKRIIGKFGGVRPMARAGHWPPSTVQSWEASGVIPARRQREVIDAGRSAGVEIAPGDFFDGDAPKCARFDENAPERARFDENARESARFDDDAPERAEFEDAESSDGGSRRHSGSEAA